MKLDGTYIRDRLDTLVVDPTTWGRKEVPAEQALSLLQAKFPEEALVLIDRGYGKTIHGFTNKGFGEVKRESGTVWAIYAHDGSWYLYTIPEKTYDTHLKRDW